MELGEFRLWCKVAAHAVHKSGIPAEDVLDKVTAHNRPTTHIFHKHAAAVWPAPLRKIAWCTQCVRPRLLHAGHK